MSEPSLPLVLELGFIEAYRALAAEDVVAARQVMTAVKALVKDPAPPDSVHWGDSLLYRLHVGDYRVLYEVDDGVRVWSLGRMP
ncbi:type II toxin-antitoxin system RelE/ParE family toxin [Kribbella sp. NPDC048928]|uniref:type II toxin-antitoxin system RelE family toxin n=1 Tax=Kribbella sp. NPDC048928 TaxID=3364111 RepID=UPI003714C0BE